MPDFARIKQLAARPSVHAAFHWIELHQPTVRRWQSELTAIPAPPFAESARAARVLALFRELGLANPRLDEVGNVLADIPGVIPSPALLLSAHLDTVFPAGTDCTVRESDDARLHAPGICDNGAGLAALLAIAAAMLHPHISPARTITFCANVGEEGEGNLRGMRHLFRANHPYAAAIVLDGSGHDVVTRALGSRRFRITLTGPGGHSWSDAGTPNPAHALARAIADLTAVPLPASPRTSLNVGRFESGLSVNAIPQSATALLDTRSESPAELARLEAALRSCVADAVTAANQSSPQAQHNSAYALTSEIVLIGDRPSGSLPDDSPLLASLTAVDRHVGLRTETRLASTDANIPLSLGIPAVSLGCGGESAGAHTLDEWFSPAGRDIALRRILLLALDLAFSL